MTQELISEARLTASSAAHAPASANGLNEWSAYLFDACQRSVLFIDLLRQRGDAEIEITARPMATVLSFAHEVLMYGRDLPRPINYALSRIEPPPGAATDPEKRPVVVIDPRAGQGPGIGGFKADSEIGDALQAGHPVYFIGFGAQPEPGQQFLDVVEGQVAFFEHVVACHPDVAKPFAIGNCQAGYQTLMVAMLRPDLFGPCLVAGSPMSYWQGVRGKYPMRYAGGMAGGSWLTALTSDLGKGRFDGTALVQNFDNLNPAYSLWGKQYEVYAHIDTAAARYLKFEQWWGDFIELNGDEMQYLADALFIGDKLARNALQSSDGTIFDIRNITSPIVVFTSTQDNISPPPQALGWIVDLYRDVDDIRATGQTIVYCLSQKVGHLAIFVSSSVGTKQDAAFIQLVEVIDYLPPGLYEMILSPRPEGPPQEGFATGDWIARFADRSLDDICALGRNSPEDNRAFAAVAKLSALNLSLYRGFMQPWVRLFANQPAADLAKAMNPLKLSYTLFANSNPWMAAIQPWAKAVADARQPVAPDNPFLLAQTQISSEIGAGLDAYRRLRDQLTEQRFFAFYGSPIVQALLGLNDGSALRPLPATSPEIQAARRALRSTHMANLERGGFNEALIRALLYVLQADHSLDQRCAFALNIARREVMALSVEDFKQRVRAQFFMLQIAPEAALAALAGMVPETDLRHALLKQLRLIVGADDPASEAENERLTRLAQLFGAPTTPQTTPVIAQHPTPRQAKRSH